MNYKILLAAFVFVFSLNLTDAVAQRGSSGAKFRSGYKRKFRPSWTVFASPGVAVMNSDNFNSSSDVDQVGVVKNNGIGPTLSVGALYQFSNSFGIQGTLGYMHFEGKEDAVNTRYPDVSFKTNALETTASLVYNLTNTYVGPRYSRSRNLRLVVPYIKAGVGFLAYKASSEVKLLGEERPDAKDYPSIALIAPLGGGLKFQYSKQLTIAPELNIYLTSSDYLDNSTYGLESPYISSNDIFLSATVKVMYNITAHRRSPFRIRRR
ncbi:outer membrane beta-barrel protein [Pontibacter sp. KCTC 32443]|uniref:outer membrane beta-barrel protein n=1 Tax=Pontibacter TaxID=323449 RepID=UPI00164DBD32|nr:MULTISPECIES: outer membrane beta-barrel protein [Pontibacter]MBC5773002.1 outer membrane beta-barrel protein [Pontibacter sp. KCTC 32443]